MAAVEQQVTSGDVAATTENRFGIKPKRVGGADERLAQAGAFTKLLRRPEAGAAGGLLATIIIFALLPGASNLYSLQGSLTFLTLSAELGIIATAAALLIIAGEFDLSVGSMIGFAGVVIGLTVRELGFPLWGGIASAFAVAVFFGYMNGLIVVKTRLPSFIVTLASLFILRGLSIGITRAVTGRTQIPYILEDVPDPWTAGLFNGHLLTGFFQWMADQGWIAARSDGVPFVTGIPASIVWWVAITVIAGYVLTQTRYGNWIFATGGDQDVARNVVIGGVLLTGGYGTVYGVLFGSLIFGLVQMGIFYTGIDTDWFKVFLGLVILAAVLVNTYIRNKALGGGRSR
jgi:simple sugar transport system permease protein